MINDNNDKRMTLLITSVKTMKIMITAVILIIVMAIVKHNYNSNVIITIIVI